MFFGRHIFTILNFLVVSHETIFSKDKTMCKKKDGEVKDKKFRKIHNYLKFPVLTCFT